MKVWEQRAYRDYDDSRSWARATSRWRCAACASSRAGHELELDLPDTIRSTAANAGWLDIKMVPERHNNVKVLLLMDVGGTMDEHIQRVEEAVFSAVKAEFKHLEFYYFHNCVYDFMWKNNRRRFAEKFPTWDIIRKYNKDYKLIFVGDATMSPYEILQPGGSVEYNNEEPGRSGFSASPTPSRSLRGSTPSPRACGNTARASASSSSSSATACSRCHSGAGRHHAPAVEVALRQRVLPRPRGRSCPTPGACFAGIVRASCRHTCALLRHCLRFHDFFFVRFCFSRARTVQGAASSNADSVVGVAAFVERWFCRGAVCCRPGQGLNQPLRSPPKTSPPSAWW